MTKPTRLYVVQVISGRRIVVEATSPGHALSEVADRSYGMKLTDFRAKHSPRVSRLKSRTKDTA